MVVRTAPSIRSSEYEPDPDLKKGRRYLVGFVGVMGSADGVHYLIDAAAHLVHTLGRRDVQFLLMGTGPEYAGMIAQRDRLGLQEYVDAPGRVSDRFLFTALQTIDVGVSCDPINPYNQHCTMNKVLEYMMFGRPQVLFDLKEGRASAGDAAVYVAEDSAIKLGEAIGSLLDAPAARERMAQTARERIRSHLGWEHSARELLRAYDIVLSAPRILPADQVRGERQA